MKKSILCTLAVFGLASVSQAAVLNFTNQLFGAFGPTENLVVDADGNTGTFVAIAGYYVGAPLGNDLAADFVSFNAVHNFGIVGSSFEITINPFTGTPNGSPGINQPVATWFFNPTFDGTFESISEYGLFVNVGQTWGNTTDDINTNIYFNGDQNIPVYTEAVYGSVTVGANATPSGLRPSTYQLVPEPSTALFGMLGVGMLLMRRRRA